MAWQALKGRKLEEAGDIKQQLREAAQLQSWLEEHEPETAYISLSTEERQQRIYELKEMGQIDVGSERSLRSSVLSLGASPTTVGRSGTVADTRLARANNFARAATKFNSMGRNSTGAGLASPTPPVGALLPRHGQGGGALPQMTADQMEAMETRIIRAVEASLETRLAKEMAKLQEGLIASLRVALPGVAGAAAADSEGR
jgi:hypothetical protein